MNDIEVLQSAPNPLGQQVEKVAGRFTGVGGIQWHTQRDVEDPGDEAEEGVDGVFDASEDISPDDFLKMLENPVDDSTETGRHLTKCGIHMAEAKAHQTAGNDHECWHSLNKAMFHFSRAHLGLKAATED
jgi:hypothetical protein